MSSFLKLGDSNKKMIFLTKFNPILFRFKNISICFLLFFNIVTFSQKLPTNSTSENNSFSTEINEADLLKAQKTASQEKNMTKQHLFCQNTIINFLKV